MRHTNYISSFVFFVGKLRKNIWRSFFLSLSSLFLVRFFLFVDLSFCFDVASSLNVYYDALRKVGFLKEFDHKWCLVWNSNLKFFKLNSSKFSSSKKVDENFKTSVNSMTSLVDNSLLHLIFIWSQNKTFTVLFELRQCQRGFVARRIRKHILKVADNFVWRCLEFKKKGLKFVFKFSKFCFEISPFCFINKLEFFSDDRPSCRTRNFPLYQVAWKTRQFKENLSLHDLKRQKCDEMVRKFPKKFSLDDLKLSSIY